MKNNAFEYKSPNFNKLLKYGFEQKEQSYTYVTTILNGQFKMYVDVSARGEITTNIIDTSTDDPYTLHLLPEANGAFVGAIRTEYERVLTEIADTCFEKDVFKSDCAHRVIDYVREKYGDELEYLWKTFPSNAVWRRKDNNKWYGILLKISKRKLGLECDDIVDIIDIRVDPDAPKHAVDGKKYFEGYHMNKKNWMTICLDGTVSASEIFKWIDISYELARNAK